MWALEPEGPWANLKGQLDLEWIYEVIVSPIMQTKNYKIFTVDLTLKLQFDSKNLVIFVDVLENIKLYEIR